MNIKKGYYYLFYKFYKFGEASPSIFPSDFTAAFAISSLEMLFLGSLEFYSTNFWGRNGDLKLASFHVIIPVASVVLINYFAFINNTKWKKYVRDFDKLPAKKNTIGTWIVIGVIAFVLVNLAFSIHLMNQIPIKH